MFYGEPRGHDDWFAYQLVIIVYHEGPDGHFARVCRVPESVDRSSLKPAEGGTLVQRLLELGGEHPGAVWWLADLQVAVDPAVSRVSSCFSRLEPLSHVLAWCESPPALPNTVNGPANDNQSSIDYIEMPRLGKRGAGAVAAVLNSDLPHPPTQIGLRFVGEKADGAGVRWTTSDVPGEKRYVSDSDRHRLQVAPWLATLSHAIILEDSSGCPALLCSNAVPVRTVIKSEPFARVIAFLRDEVHGAWANIRSRYFMWVSFHWVGSRS